MPLSLTDSLLNDSPLNDSLIGGPRLNKSLLANLQACRGRTLTLIDDIAPTVLNTQSHPEFSPVGWHLGHIAYTEALWILGEESSRYKTLFAADGLPKAERQNLPALSELLVYLETVRGRTLAKIEQTPVEQDQLRLLHWLLQHEGQHAETMTMVMMMHRQDSPSLLQKLASSPAPRSRLSANSGIGQVEDMVKIEGAQLWQGANAEWAIDNEMPARAVSVEDFWIDRHPVTCDQFAQFMSMGGYEKEQWWSEEGWAWKMRSRVSEPLYWSRDPSVKDKPVCGVSWYEAEAYARSRGKRLPAESEWEKAASSGKCQGMLGNVWEWTHTWFDGYEGFQPFPYAGYSQAYFDNQHRVLKGGSWASPNTIIRKSFRNWYHPHRRELFSGFRCAL